MNDVSKTTNCSKTQTHNLGIKKKRFITIFYNIVVITAFVFFNIKIVNASDEKEVLTLEKMVVTGSHIKRIDIEGPSPLIVIDRIEIERSGANSVAGLLRKLPEFNGGSMTENAVFQLAPGSAGISLHGLGQDNVLVLLNGRRVANYGFSQEITESFVDLNTMPLAAIERVEILKDGASAIYGSDAIAGVVNVITRKDTQGADISLQYGETRHGDGETGRFDVVAGNHFQNSRITAIFSYLGRDNIMLKDRDFSQSADQRPAGGYDDRSIYGNPGSALLSSIIFPAPDPACPDDRNDGLFCHFDQNPSITAVPETERVGGMLLFEHDFSPTTTLFSELSYQQVQTDAFLGYASTSSRGRPEVPASHPNNPFGEDIELFYRFTELGIIESEVETDSLRLLMGLKGSIDLWEWEVAALYSDGDTDQKVSNVLNKVSLQQMLNSGQFNPFGGASNDPAVLNALRAQSYRQAESELSSIDFKMNGELLEMQHGALGLATGLAFRHESLSDASDDDTLSGNVTGYATNTKGERDVLSAFAELSIPVLESLELQLAARYENYDDFGDTTNPKIALRFQALDNLVFRVSAATAFRAPSLAEQHLNETYVFGSSPEPDSERCVLTNSPVDCDPRSVEMHFTGNPDLEPETSESFNLGMTWEIIPNLTLISDIWRLKHEDVIDVDFTTQTPARNPQSPADVAQGIPGTLDHYNVFFSNLGTLKADGIDLELRFIPEKTHYGQFDTGVRMSYLKTYKRQFTPHGEYFEFDGKLASEADGGGPEPDAHPKRKGYAYINWQKSDYQANVQFHYISSYNDARLEPNTGKNHKIDSWFSVDGQLSYQGWEPLTVTLGANNIFDEEPPYAYTDGSNRGRGYDVNTHNPVGRFVYLRLNYHFD